MLQQLQAAGGDLAMMVALGQFQQVRRKIQADSASIGRGQFQEIAQGAPAAAAEIENGLSRAQPGQSRQRAVKAAGVIGNVAGSHDSPISRFPWDLVSRSAPSPEF